MCELAAEVDSDNEEEEEAAAAECIEDIPDIAGFRMTRNETEQGTTRTCSCHVSKYDSQSL